MRANMDPLNPMASTLDPAIAQIYSQAAAMRESLRETVPAPGSDEGRRREQAARQRKARELAVQVLATPARLRDLVKAGKMQEAKTQWEMPRRLLLAWKEQGVGGDDVAECLAEGDALFKPPESTQSTQRTSRDSR